MSNNIENTIADATNALALASVCAQRKQVQLLSIPPIRLELQPSPYPTFTQQQLNMRRKFEILKYSGVNQNTKTNSQTKTNKWTQLVSGNNGRNSISASLYGNYSNLVDGRYDCSGDIYIPTPTSSCDVPGPVMILKYDDTVPLYNYATQIDSYAIIDEISDDLWRTYPVIDTPFLTDISTQSTSAYSSLTLLYIQPIVDQRTYNFRLKTSVGINVSGITSASGQIHDTLSITKLDLVICYNNVPLKEQTINIGSFKQLSFDVSGGKTFSGALYVGDIDTTFNLITEPNYVYDLKLRITFSIGKTDTIQYLNTVGAYANLSYTKIETNCSISTTPYQSIITPFSFVSV
jgi:hypothetical protein